MHLDEHGLVKEAMTNSMLQISQIPNFEDLNHEELDSDLSMTLNKCLRYDYGVMQWSLYVTEVLYRLQEIIDMTSRKIYKRNDEERGIFLKEWVLYNYEFYTLTYQSVRDVSLLLTNEVFDLGILYRNCNEHTVCSNRHLRGTKVKLILIEISNMSAGHRKMKDFLLHRGQRIKSLPVVGMKIDDLDKKAITKIAHSIGRDIGYTKTMLRELFSERDRKRTISVISKEYKDLEEKIKQLFDELLPHYRKIHQSYSQSDSI